MELDDLPSTNRYELLKILGGKCRICFINKIKYLEIDHIYNDGADERTKYGSSEKIYGWYLQHKNQAFRRLQPLCKEHHEEKRHLILQDLQFHIQMNTKPNVSIITSLLTILKSLEGEPKRPVSKTTLIQELEKKHYTNKVILQVISDLCKGCNIYESKLGCYNSA